MHKTMCRFSRTREIKRDLILSLVSGSPASRQNGRTLRRKREGASVGRQGHEVCGRVWADLDTWRADGALRDDLLPLVRRKQVWYLTRVQYVVHVLNESFDHDLSVSEQEDNGDAVAACDEVKLLQVLPELHVAVPLGELDLKAFHLREVRGKPGEGLLAGATDADKHCIAAGLAEYAREAGDMLNGIPEKDEAHLLVF